MFGCGRNWFIHGWFEETTDSRRRPRPFFLSTSSYPQKDIQTDSGASKKGSRTDTKSSGESSDAAFAKLVVIWCLQPEVISAFSIDVYGRFKVDIFIMAGDRRLTKHCVWGKKRRSKHYRIRVDEHFRRCNEVP